MSRRFVFLSPLVLLMIGLTGCFSSKSPEPVPTSAGILSGITTITSTPLPPCTSAVATVPLTATATGTAGATATDTSTAAASATATATGSATASASGTAGAVATLVPTLCATPTPLSIATTTSGSATAASGSATPGGSATPTRSATPSAGAAGTYTVKDGDSIGSIAVALNTTSQAIIDANNLSDPNLITVGQVLKVPTGAAGTPAAGATSTGGVASTAAGSTPRPATPAPPAPPASPAATSASTRANTITAGTPAAGAAGGAQSYTVQGGDTACKIAASFKVSLDSLATANSTTSSALSALQVGQVLKIPASTGATSAGC